MANQEISIRSLYVCAECGSLNIREAVFRWINSKEAIEEYGRVFPDAWCEDCDAETSEIITLKDWIDKERGK